MTVGTFDGVHVGHRALVVATVEEARRRGLVPVALTWDRHPLETLRPGSAPGLLTTLDRRVELLRAAGAERIVVLSFDEELSRWPPEKFARDALVDAIGAEVVVVGEGWRFGHRAAGDVALLARLGPELGFEARAIALRRDEEGEVSSSRIRRLIASGDVEAARALLGRPIDFDGVVVPGDRRGAALGYPTANLSVEARLVRAARGIYAGRARTPWGWHRAAISIGVNPTFGGDPQRSPIRIEAFLLDYDGDLYGRTLRIELHRRLRDEMSFESTAALVAQMELDVEATRSLSC